MQTEIPCKTDVAQKSGSTKDGFAGFPFPRTETVGLFRQDVESFQNRRRMRSSETASLKI